MRAGWITAPLGEFADLVSTGPFGSILHKSDYVSSGVPLINPINIVEERITPDPEKQVSADAVARLSSYVLRTGDVVVARRGEIGRCAVVGPDATGWVCGTGCFFVRPKATLDAVFLAHLLRSPHYRELLERASTGATMKNMSNAALAQLPISLPATDEQRRIVAILDEAFEGIATAKANAEKNLQNARELFDGHLERVFAVPSKDWLRWPLGSVTSKIGSGATPLGGEDSYKIAGIALIRSLNVYDDGFRYAKLARLDDAQAARLSNVEVQARDVLLNITGASVARCCLVPDDVLPARVNQHVSIIRPDSSQLDPEFLHYQLTAKSNKDRLLGIGADGGSTRQAITKAQIQSFSVVFPMTVEDQRSIARALGEIRLKTESLAEVYVAKLSALDELKRSLLHQAFSGGLS